MKISENPMESEFCSLNVLSRTEAVANATRGGESQCEGAGHHDPSSRTSRNALYDGESEDELDG
jgi:hypothetical protein